MITWRPGPAILILGVATLVSVFLVLQGEAMVREHLRASLSASRFPRPTGPFPVGIVSVDLVTDAAWPSRIDVWYPAKADFIGMRQRAGQILERLLHPTRAAGLRQVAAEPGAHPLILYVPSWFSTRSENTFAVANLASHGFVVAAVDDIVHGAPLIGHDRTAQVTSLDYSSEIGFATSRSASRRRARLGARAAAATINGLIAYSTLGPRIDAARVGVLGFSFGGSIAAAMSRETGRLRAVVNLDGDVIETESWPPAMPYLFLTSDLPYPTAADLTSENLAFRFESITTRDTYDLHMHPDIPPTCSALSVKGAVHTDFSDRVVVPSFRNLWTARAPDRMALWSDINRVIVAFLSAHLGDPATHAMPRDALPMDALPMRFVKLPSR